MTGRGTHDHEEEVLELFALWTAKHRVADVAVERLAIGGDGDKGVAQVLAFQAEVCDGFYGQGYGVEAVVLRQVLRSQPTVGERVEWTSPCAGIRSCLLSGVVEVEVD